jgi:hypothetical protein
MREMDRDPYDDWIKALLQLTRSPAHAHEFQIRRYSFSASLAQSLIDSLPEPGLDRVLYGVWINEHSAPVYVGQTSEGRRRLWDLPIGESHHLANTFPPEIWARVVHVNWQHMLEDKGLLDEIVQVLTTSYGIPTATVLTDLGLGLEFLLQRAQMPLFNSNKKTRAGQWRAVSYANGTSRGARIAPFLNSAFQHVLECWNELVSLESMGMSQVVREFGSVVYPAVLRSQTVDVCEH